MKKKLTINQREWEKELKRIKQFIRRAEKRGFSFDVPIPERPKAVRKSHIKALKELTPSKLYARATYITPEGETISGYKGRQQERARAAAKGATRSVSKVKPRKVPTRVPRLQDILISNIRTILDEFTPDESWSSFWKRKKEHDRNVLRDIFEQAIKEHGEATIAKRLQKEAKELNDIIMYIMYGSKEEDVNKRIVEFAELLKGDHLTWEENAALTEYQQFEVGGVEQE